jgi:choline dehydrogenase
VRVDSLRPDFLDALATGIDIMRTRFDFIVVGAGSSGCTLAHRLAQLQPQAEVLLLEAGSRDWHPMIHVPLGFAFLLGRNSRNWGFQTDPVPQLAGRRLDLPQGRMLGGTSSLNGMVYVRGQREDFDSWAAAGNAGWSYDEVLPYFRRSEHYHGRDEAYHGHGGPLQVAAVGEPLPITEAFLEAARRYGLRANADFNGECQRGVGFFDANTLNGRRHSAARAFLARRVRPPNLTVHTHLQAASLLWRGNRAQGIECHHHGRSVSLYADCEIALSAGVFNTPKLLELSGVGDPARLGALDIPVVSPLRGVGENLHDHLNAYVECAIESERTYYDFVSSWRLLPTLGRWVFARKGILRNSAAIAGAFFSTDPADGRPDAQVHFAPSASRLDQRGWMIPIPAITAAVCVLQPGSRGHSHVCSRDVSIAPRIQPNYLDTAEDRRRSVRALRILREILSTPPFADHVSGELRPGPAASSDEELLDYFRSESASVHHCVGTCKMGCDDRSVVDAQLRVHGVEGLRVADASIMPTITSGNTHAACVMIGEKAADMISGRAG